MTEKQKPAADLIIRGAAEVLTCVPEAGNPIGRRSDVLVAIAGKKIAAIGSPAEVERKVDLSTAAVFNAEGKIIAPGFIDCHTHVIFAGSRSQEYAARMTKSLDQISELGIPVGIQGTVAMTREATRQNLNDSGKERLLRMFACGTTTVESKSGYGLTVDKEIEILRVNRQLNEELPIDIISTFLGAHDFPPELPRDDYIDLVINGMIPKVGKENLAEFCDVYCDEGYYSVEEARRILRAGIEVGLKSKTHVDAYSDIGGALMAAELGVVSADHLNYTKPVAIQKMAEVGVIGVVMPALDFAVGHKKPFDARVMLDLGLTLALATDICPGCWTESMQYVMQLACRLYRFSPEEALFASTVGAAKALDLEDRGTIEPGKLADLQIWDVPTFEDIIYRLGNNAVSNVIKHGEVYNFKQGNLWSN